MVMPALVGNMVGGVHIEKRTMYIYIYNVYR